MTLPPIDRDESTSSGKPEKTSNRLKTILKRFDRNFLIAAGVAALALVLVLGYTITNAIMSSSDSPKPTETSTSEPEPPKPSTPATAPTAEPANPLAIEGVSFAEPKDAKDPVTVAVKDNTVISSQAGTPTLVLSKDNKVTKATTDCKVKDTLSFCLVATTQFGSQSFDYFYSRDIAHSKLLRSPEDTRQVKIDGAASAAFVTINFGDQGKRRVLAIAAQDSSGYLIILPERSGTSTEDTLLAGLTLK